jgi:hypothetical protein
MWRYNNLFKVIIIVVIIAAVFATEIVWNSNNITISGTVTMTAVKNYNNDSKYLIWVKKDDGGIVVIEDTDCFIRGKFDSSDMYGEIKKGHHYVFHLTGHRVRVFSLYENILDVTPTAVS